MSSNTIRFTGMASGMDTESMVKAMVKRYQEKVDDKKKSQTLLEWKKDAYSEVSSKVNTFYSSIVRKSRLNSSFSTKALTSSNADKVSVKSSGTATEGTHKIDYVSQVGEGAVINTSTIGQIVTGKINPTSSDVVSASTQLGSIGLEENMSIKISDGRNSREILLETDDTIESVTAKINALNDGSSHAINVAASFDATNGKFKITSGEIGTNAQSISIKASDDTKSDQLKTMGLSTSKLTKTTKLSELGITSRHVLKVNSGSEHSDVIINGDMTLGELAAEITQELDHGTASFDETAGAFFISSKGTGSSQTISLSVSEGDLGNDLLERLGIGRSLSMVNEAENRWAQVFEMDTTATSLSTRLEDAFSGVNAYTPLEIKINGTAIRMDASCTMQDLVDKIKEETGSSTTTCGFAGGKMRIGLIAEGLSGMPSNELVVDGSTLTQVSNVKEIKFSSESGIIGKDTKLGTQNGDRLKLTIGGSDTYINLSSSSTVNTIMTEVKNALGLSDDDITLSNDGSLIIKNLTSDISIGIEKNVDNFSAQGKNAIFSYNGIEMQSESNTVAVNGMELTINNKTDDPVYINVTNDTDASFKFITEFVDAYNTLIEYGNKKVHADSYGTLKPLTSEEKEAMTDSDVDAWEKKIKDGLLRNDSTLSDLLSNMRTILSSVVGDADYKSLSSIGITTSSKLSDRGKLILDEETLKKALAENPDDVTSLFTGSGRSAKRAYLEANSGKTAADYEALSDDDKKKWESKVDGIGNKLYTLLDSHFKYVSGTKTSSSIYNDTTLEDDIKSTKSEYDRLVDILNDKEDYYYKKLASMETTMNKLNSQQNYISQMFAS